MVEHNRRHDRGRGNSDGNNNNNRHKGRGRGRGNNTRGSNSRGTSDRDVNDTSNPPQIPSVNNTSNPPPTPSTNNPLPSYFSSPRPRPHPARKSRRTSRRDSNTVADTNVDAPGIQPYPGPEPEHPGPQQALRDRLEEILPSPDDAATVAATQDRIDKIIGNILRAPESTAAAVTAEEFTAGFATAGSGNVSTSQPHAPQEKLLRKLPFHPRQIKKRKAQSRKGLNPWATAFHPGSSISAPSTLTNSGPSHPNRGNPAAQSQVFMAQPGRMPRSAPTTQVQDLAYRPGGIPDVLPAVPQQMPGLDPMFLPGPDGKTSLPLVPSGPLPDLGTQFSKALGSPTKLVVVCCLATWTGKRDTDNTWIAMPGQGKRRGWGLDMANSSEKECWKMQICKGLEVLKGMDGQGVLVFSGGPWLEGTSTSAARSYYDFAKASNYWGYFRGDKYKDYPSRIFMEDRAMDSMQHILFSLIDFNYLYLEFPLEMTIISYELKRRRFENLHFPAIKDFQFPTAQQGITVKWQGIPTFIGINPRELKDISKSDKAKALTELEAEVFDIWNEEGSRYGVSKALTRRRAERNKWCIDLNPSLVIASGSELVAALEEDAKNAPPIKEIADMSAN